MTTSGETFVERREGDTAINVLVGGAVGAAVSLVVPVVGQFVGGGVAGYLQRTSPRSAATVGGGAAALSTVPFALLAGLFSIPFVLGNLMAGVNEGTGLLAGFTLVVFLFVAVVGLLSVTAVGAFGGWLGASLHGS